MKFSAIPVAVAVAVTVMLGGCGKTGKVADDGPDHANCGIDHSDPGALDKKAAEPAAQANPLSTPKESMKHQFALLKAGKVDELRACLTPRLRDRVNARMIEEGAAETAKMTFEDLYDSEAMDEYEGLRTCKVKMKSGRILTTLVLDEDKWLADTIWFK